MHDFRDLTAAQQRQLEKRYGDVREVFRRRADEAGLDLALRSDSIREITDPERMRKHFGSYRGTVLDLAVRNIRSLAGLYSIRANGRPREVHVVWIFGETENTIRKESDFFEEIGAIRDDDLDTTFQKIPNRVFEKLYGDPALLGKLNEILLLSYIDVLEFHNWKVVPKGMVISGTNFLAAVRQFHLSNFNNDALGIEVGMGLIEDIIGRKDKDVETLRKAVFPILAHEMVHLQNGAAGETHAYAVEMLLVNQEDEAEVGALRDDLEIVKISLGNGLELPPNDYYSQAYKGIVLAMDEFAKYNYDIANLFKKDATKYKVGSVLAAMDMVRDSDAVRAKESGFIDKILSLDNEQIEDAFRSAKILERE